ncbi:ABC-type transport auxiliary lipoprotein family protein [Cereibacter sphaeroides]|uniref:ABC-type transport auxiliary lipoprotein family protein n=1 Tax=Cereibacter sphaeroides TaxID=1063 RepID=UPI001F1F6623|nr:ABC-type transport auxiliary lipoprotein family protein [Cereibacter sphaeroides]MCE6952799.1 ABC-type transport auxiliary lipoprotein family protein [Cereibacter sphaeroides]
MRALILTAALAAALPLSGCGAFSSLSRASEALDTYTLSPLPGQGGSGSGITVVEAASSGGALATDRILIKPSRVQAQYLPDARWSDPAPALVQTLLVGSLQNAGGFRLVARDAAGLVPDYTLMTELRDFQAEAPPGQPPVVKVGLTLTLIREDDRSILATRRVDARAQALSDATGDVIVAFEAATTQALSEAAPWVRSRTR